MPAGLGLGYGPAGRLLYAVTLSAACSGVATAGAATLVVRLGMLEV